MNTYSGFGKLDTYPTSLVIEFDVIQLDILVRDISVPSYSPYAYERPYLTVMAVGLTNQIFCYTITLKCPSVSDPLNTLTISHQGCALLQQPGLVICADPALFCCKLLNGVFWRAVFYPAHTDIETRSPLESTITGLARGLKDILPVRALPGGVSISHARSVGQLRATLGYLIKASNIARNARVDMAWGAQFMHVLGKQP